MNAATLSGLACLLLAMITGLYVQEAKQPLMLLPPLLLSGWLLASGRLLTLRWTDLVLLLLLGLTAVWAISLSVSPAPFNSRVTLVILATLPLGYMVWQSVRLTPGQQQNVILCLLGIASVCAAAALVNFFSPGYWRASWPFLDPNLLGLFLSLAGLAALPLLRNKNFHRPLLAALALLLFGLLATQSRAALLGTLFGGGFLLFHFRHQIPRTRRTGLWAAGFALIAAAGAVATGFFSRWLSIFSGDIEISSRFSLWTSALEMSLKHPLRGFGIGTFGTVYPLYREPGGDNSVGWWVHMDPLQWAVESGGAAPVLFYSLVTVVFLKARRKSLSPLQAGAGAALLALFVNAHAAYPLHVVPFLLLAGFFLSVLIPPVEAPLSSRLRYAAAGLVSLMLVALIASALRAGGTLYLWNRVEETRRTNIYQNFEADLTACLEKADRDFPFCRLLLIETTLQMSTRPGESLLPLIEQAREDFPALPQPDYFLGLYYRDSSLPLAIEAFHRAVIKMPTFWIGRKALVEALAADEQYPQAYATLIAGGNFPIPNADQSYYTAKRDMLLSYMHRK